MNRLIMLITIAVRNIRRNLRRTALCIVAVGIAVFFTIIAHSMIRGMTENVDNVVRTFDTGDVAVVSADYEANQEFMPVQYPVSNGMSEDDLTALVKKAPDVKYVFPRIMTLAALENTTEKNGFLWGFRIADETAAHSFNLTKKTDGLIEGRWPSADGNECAIGKTFADKTGLHIGDTVLLGTMSAHFSDRIWEPVITGIFNFDYLKYDDGAIIVQYDRLAKLLGMDGTVQQLFIYGKNPNKSPALTKEVTALIGKGNVVHEWRDNYFAALIRQAMMIHAIIYLVFLGVASFLIVNTIIMIINERIKEIGMMGSLGMTRPEITGVFFFEASFLSVLGSLAGCIVGGIVTFTLSFFPLDFNAAFGGGFKEMPVSGTLVFTLHWDILLQSFILGIVVASICILFPSIKSAFIDPVEALRR